MEPFIGEIRMMPYHYAPQNWIPCDGRQLLIAQYQALYAVIGITWGGEPAAGYFLAPNLKNRAAIGAGSGPGLTPRALAAEEGTSTETITDISQIASHNHTLHGATAGGAALSFLTATPGATTLPARPEKHNASSASPETFPIYSNVAPNATLVSTAIGYSASNGAAHNNLQPYLNLAFFIAALGVYPARS